MNKKQTELYQDSMLEIMSVWKKVDTVLTYQVWEACVRANKIEDAPVHPAGYSIGERVEVKSIKTSEAPFEGGSVCILTDRKHHIFDGKNYEIRRPKFSPVDGDRVLFNHDGLAVAGFIQDGILFALNLKIPNWKETTLVKPFDGSKIGFSWDEV
jgi:hypothetical protein